MTTAQDLFAVAVRDRLPPRTEALGFRAAASKFTLPSHTRLATIGLQKSTFSDRSSLKFTANRTGFQAVLIKSPGLRTPGGAQGRALGLTLIGGEGK